MSTRAIQITEMRLGISKVGVPLNGGYVRFKLAGTETLATVWQDRGKALEADNPIQLDTNGRALVYADGVLKLEVFDGDPAGSGALLWTWDNQKYRAPNAQTSTKTANYEITPDDDMILGDATSGALTFTLQASANYVSPVFVKKIDASANNVVINPASGETIDGSSSMSLTAQNETLHIFPDGSDWWSVKLTSVETAENSDTVDNIHAAATAQPNKLLALDANSKLPGSITGDADTVDSIHAAATATANKLLALNGSSQFPNTVVPNATTSAAGKVELATTAETQTGADTTRAVTPSGLANLGKSHATNGYQKLPGGTIIQWGSATAGVGTQVTFPIAFPTACRYAGAQLISTLQIDRNIDVDNITTTGFKLYSNGYACRWLAIGY